MKNKYHQSLTVLTFLIFLMVSLNNLSCKPTNPFVRTPISGIAVIDNNEREIIFNRSFKPKKMVNKICFEYIDNLKADVISESPKFSDGIALQLTASVVDQNGKKYELNHIENSVEKYLCIIPDKYWLDISKTDTVFIKLLVYSNRKLNLSKIEWVSYDIWDI